MSVYASFSIWLSIFLSKCSNVILLYFWLIPLQGPRTGHHRPGIEGDDLIISGDGANCYDDEDCTAYTTEPNTDDLITPRLVMVSPRPPYTPLEHGFRTSTVRPYSTTCDDEDCMDGSGNGSDDEDEDDDDDDRRPPHRVGAPSTPRAAVPHHGHGQPSISYSWPGMRTPSPTPYYVRTPVPTPYEDKSIMFTSKPIPPTGPDVLEELYTKRPTPPPRPTGPRVIIDVPKPERPLTFPHVHHHGGKGGEHHHNVTLVGHGLGGTVGGRTPPHLLPQQPSSSSSGSTGSGSSTGSTSSLNPFSRSSSDRTALVIGVIAGTIIVIVIIASIFVCCRVKYRPLTEAPLPQQSIYGTVSIDNRKNYNPTTLPVGVYNPVVSGTTGPPGLMGGQPPSSVSVTHLNGGGGPPVPGEFKAGQTPLLPKKDLKEWYVWSRHQCLNRFEVRTWNR